MPILLCSFAADESGATAIEYGLFTALCTIGLMTAMGALAESLGDIVDLAVTHLSAPRGGGVAVIPPPDPV
jgi:Flp pilus assembly pilin Flp